MARKYIGSSDATVLAAAAAFEQARHRRICGRRPEQSEYDGFFAQGAPPFDRERTQALAACAAPEIAEAGCTRRGDAELTVLPDPKYPYTSSSRRMEDNHAS